MRKATTRINKILAKEQHESKRYDPITLKQPGLKLNYTLMIVRGSDRLYLMSGVLNQPQE